MNQYGFVPAGHAAIIPIRVVAAWPHETGAWLSIQAIGPAMALVWRSSDSWAATACLVEVVCDTLDRESNYKKAIALAEYLVNEGPPPQLLASAKRSAEVRSLKASNAANARWTKGERKQATTQNAALPKKESKPDPMLAGPVRDDRLWEWEKTDYGYRLNWRAGPPLHVCHSFVGTTVSRCAVAGTQMGLTCNSSRRSLQIMPRQTWVSRWRPK